MTFAYTVLDGLKTAFTGEQVEKHVDKISFVGEQV